MTTTSKPVSGLDEAQTLRGAYNEVNDTLSVDGYLTGMIGRKVSLAISTTSISNDTETYTFSENGITLYVIKVIYTDGSRGTMISAERIS